VGALSSTSTMAMPSSG